MDKIQIRVFKDIAGSPFPVVVRNGVFPACLYLNAYLNGNHNSPLTQSISTQTPAFNTLKKYADELKFLYCHFSAININLVIRVENGIFLSRSEIDDFVRVSKRPFDINRRVEKSNIINITERRIQKAIHETKSSIAHVSAHTSKQRLVRLRSYIEHLYVCHYYNNLPTDKTLKVEHNFRIFLLYLNKYISDTRKDNVKTKDPFESVLPTEKFFELLDIILVASVKNPFKSSKLRNQIIMQILIETGVRIGAILKLKISDLIDDWHNPRFLLTRTPNDTSDKRRNPAKNKTKALSVSISRELMKQIKFYICTQRAKHAQSLEHSFVFVAEKGPSSGNPVTYEQIHKVVVKFGNTINIKLHPHLLRHKWNETFTTQAELAGFDQAQIEDLRKYCMGWSQNSKMEQVYNQFKLALKVSELSTANQLKTVPRLGNHNEQNTIS